MDLGQLIKLGEETFGLRLKYEAHTDQLYSFINLDFANKLAKEFKSLDLKLPFIPAPKTLEELYVAELKRICQNLKPFF